MAEIQCFSKGYGNQYFPHNIRSGIELELRGLCMYWLLLLWPTAWCCWCCCCFDFFLASLKLGGSCSCSRSILRNSSMVSRLEAVSLKSPSLFLMVPSDSFTTLATSLTDLLKLCSLAATSSAAPRGDKKRRHKNLGSSQQHSSYVISSW